MSQPTKGRRDSVVIAFALLILLQGCSGSRNESGITSPSAVRIQGSVGDGPVVASIIAVTDRNGAEIDRIESDQFASYAVDVPADPSRYPLTFTATGGTDMVTGVDPDFTLTSVLIDVPFAGQTVNLSPFTTLIVAAAESLPGAMTRANLDTAVQLVTGSLSFGLDDELVADPIGTAVTGTNIANIVKSSEVAGEAFRRISKVINNSSAVQDVDDIVLALGADIIDEVVDGRGATGSDARIAAASNVVGSQVLIESFSNQLRVNGVKGSSAMDQAIKNSLPEAPDAARTGNVPIIASALDQAKLGVKSALALMPSPTLTAVSDALDMLTPAMLPAAAAPMVPVTLAQALQPVADLVPSASEAELESANEVARTNTPLTLNRAPNISGTPATVVDQGAEYSFTPSASDADGDPLVYAIENMPGWASFSTQTGQLRGTPGSNDFGLFPGIVISVTDGMATSALPSFDIAVNELVPDNGTPSISGAPATSVAVGENYEFVPMATDPDGDSLSFTIVNLPNWTSFDDRTGRLSGIPGVQDAGSYPGIVIQVSDGVASAALPQFSMNVIDNGAGAPVLNSAARIGDTYQLAWAAPTSSPDGGYDIIIDGVDTNATHRTSLLQQTVSGLNTFVEHCFSIQARYLASSQLFSSNEICVAAQEPNPVNQPPTISGAPPAVVDEGQEYRFTPVASDPDGDQLTFSVANMPAWLTFESATGTLSGVPGSVDVRTYAGIVIAVSDVSATVALPSFDITVNPITVSNTPPTISGAPATQVDEGSFYSFQPTAADADGDDLIFSITNRPGWATFDAANGILSGTPGASDLGVHANIVIRVSDSTTTVALPAFSITVNAVAAPNSPPTISGQPSGSVMVDSAYSFAPTASDPDNDALTFIIINQPSWASFNTTTGELSGTPGAGDLGSYANIVISASDGRESVSLPSFSIDVIATAMGSATLSWTAPASNADGTSLTDLAGFRIYWGNASGDHPNSVTINNPSITTYLVEDLVPGTYYFVCTAFDMYSNESAPSNEAIKTIP